MSSGSHGGARVRRQWLLWVCVLIIATLTLVAARGDIEQSHVALVFLLVVLGGSAGGGRALGYALAVLGFVLIDYFFQAPYGLISVGKALDWVVLAAFLASAFVATELVARAREEADNALRRTEEVASLSRLGSETLRHARADDALNAVASLIRATLRAEWCTIRPLPATMEGGSWTSAVPPDADGMTQRRRGVEERLVSAGTGEREASENDIALMVDDDVAMVDSFDKSDGKRRIAALGVPLFAESRLVGMLIVGGSQGTPLSFDPASRRFTATLSYYAALGLERVRLAKAAAESNELREANRMKDEVIATVSHDLRTPLTTIKLLAQAAAKRGDPAAASIEEQADRLARLVTNVLDLSAIRAGIVQLDLALNTAEDVIAAAAVQAEGQLRGRRLATAIDLSQPELVARFDFVQTLRILGNLIDNALRYSPEGGEVEVSAARVGEWMDMSVMDRGPGVALAERARIFDAFYRPRSEPPDAGSAGLGLSIARQLADLQNGSVVYSAREGGGSVFTIRLPAVDWDPSTVDDE